MKFESSNKSVVRSVKQGELLNAWLRVLRRERAMPLIHQFDVARLDEEKPDLMHYEISRADGGIRFMILHGGANLAQTFRTDNREGRYLDEIVDAERLRSIEPPLLASIETRRPVYTVAAVSDVGGVPVTYERLVLPFGAGNTVQQVLVSLKSISIEGRFTTKDLMGPGTNAPSYQLCAVIDRDLDTSPARIAVADDVFEI